MGGVSHLGTGGRRILRAEHQEGRAGQGDFWNPGARSLPLPCAVTPALCPNLLECQWLQDMEEADRFPRLGQHGAEQARGCRRPGREERVWEVMDLHWTSEQMGLGDLPMPGIRGWSLGDGAGHPPAPGFWLALLLARSRKGALGKPRA